jgi:hypothetical protein
MRLGISSGDLPGRLRSSETGIGNKKLFCADVRGEIVCPSKKFHPRIRRMEQVFMARGRKVVKGMTDRMKKLLNGFIVTE